jgi:hypothetical protein
MRRLVRSWCKVCGEMTTWEANGNRPIRCLDGEHLACVMTSQAQAKAKPKKAHARKLTAILGILHSVSQEHQS